MISEIYGDLLAVEEAHKMCSIKRSVLKNFAKFTGKHLCGSLFLIKLQTLRPRTLLKTESSAGVFCLFHEFLKSNYFVEPDATATSAAASNPLKSFHLSKIS